MHNSVAVTFPLQMITPSVSSTTGIFKTCPEVVRQDINKHTDILKSSLTMLSGKVKKQTLLPISQEVQTASIFNQ